MARHLVPGRVVGDLPQLASIGGAVSQPVHARGGFG
jgi:hypothetical protein